MTREELDAMPEERKMLLLGIGLPVLMEIRLLELSGRMPAIEKLGSVLSPVVTETAYVLDGHRFEREVGAYLVVRGLLEQYRGPLDAHVRLTAWGQDFVLTCIKKTVMWSS